jgi:hypothetical protein
MRKRNNWNGNNFDNNIKIVLHKILTNGDFRSLIITNNYVDKKGGNMEDNLIKILNLKLFVLNGGHINDEEFRNLKTIKGYQEYCKNIRFKKKK